MIQAIEPRSVHDSQVIRIKIRKGRLLLIKAALGLAGMGVVLCGLVLWQRDTTRRNEALARTQLFAGPLQREVDRIGALPLRYPADADLGPLSWDYFSYLPVEAIEQLRKWDRPVMVGHGLRSPRLYLRGSGTSVLMFDKGKLSVRWMSNADFIALRREQEAHVAAQAERARTTAPELP